jgi:hypothetical protein
MNMCQEHWGVLRTAIADRGLSALVAEDGEKAAANVARELTDGPSLDSYDPLMAAFYAIGGNGMDFIAKNGGNPLALMHDDPTMPFPRCTICYLNWMMDQHDLECTEADCQKPKGELAHYDWMIGRAADDQVEAWKAMQP